MSSFQLFNGEFYPANEPLVAATNRGFNYGDGFFESIRVANGRVPFINEHWHRLQRVLTFLEIDAQPDFTINKFNQHVLALVAKNGFKNGRVRFQGYRLGSGRYTPEESTLGWSMVCEPFAASKFELNKKGLTVAVCKTHSINPAPQSSYKTSNALPYVLGGIYAKKAHVDDCLLVDPKGFIAEATGSNIFLLNGNVLSTPDLSNGGVGGVMRSVVLSEAKSAGFSCKQVLVSEDDLLAADEVFLTNASKGIRWVGAFGKKRYFKRGAQKLVDHINLQYKL